MGDFEKLTSPCRIGRLEVRNRMISTALVTDFADECGLPTEQYIRYHEEKARGEWGLVITEDYAILPDGKTHERLPGLWADFQTEPHAEFVRRVHDAGGTIGVQLFHPGRATSKQLARGNLIAPSAVTDCAVADMPREMSESDIRIVVEAFATAALRAKACGFDLIEIHGAHGYLLHQFLSSTCNKRCDAYGGPVSNRARFALEVVRAIRDAVGPDFPLSFRLSVNDYIPGGITPAEARVVARMLVKEGVDLINCTQGMPASRDVTIPPTDVPPAPYVKDAASIKSAVNILVAAVGRLNDPYIAEDVLDAGMADFIAMGRQSLADPCYPKKVEEGRPEDIIPCIACLRGCTGENTRGHSVRCALNPRTGREVEYNEAFGGGRSTSPQDVLVVGGGVAGMQAAITARKRGHEVELLESDSVLGGQWRLAAVPPGKEPLSSFCSWQQRQLEKLGVKVRLGVTATSLMVAQANPDVVIVATGSVSSTPPIPGLWASTSVADARDVLAGKVAVEGSVIVLGGGQVGAETAAFVAQQGCKVTIVEMGDAIAADAEPLPRKHLLEFLRDCGVEMLTGTKVVRIEGVDVWVERNQGQTALTGFDSIVTAFGACCDASLAQSIRATNFGGRVIVVGDARCVASAFENVRDAHEVALGL